MADKKHKNKNPNIHNHKKSACTSIFYSKYTQFFFSRDKLKILFCIETKKKLKLNKKTMKNIIKFCSNYLFIDNKI